MTRIATLLGGLVALGSAWPAHANPVSYGHQLCVMLNSEARLHYDVNSQID